MRRERGSTVTNKDEIMNLMEKYEESTKNQDDRKAFYKSIFQKNDNEGELVSSIINEVFDRHKKEIKRLNSEIEYRDRLIHLLFNQLMIKNDYSLEKAMKGDD